MELSRKQKTFPESFSTFLKSRKIFENFEKKDDPDRLSISEITDSENVVR